MAEVTYYFDVRTFGGWGNDPAYMVDGILTNYAYTNSDGDMEPLTENTCPGTDLGTITKVELRAYGYGDGNDRIDLTPIGGSECQLTMPGSEGWSVYADITPEKPEWLWSEIVALDVNVEYDKVGKGNTMYCSMVEVRVTYTPAGPPSSLHRRTLQEPNHSGRRGFDEVTGHRRGFWPA